MRLLSRGSRVRRPRRPRSTSRLPKFKHWSEGIYSGWEERGHLKDLNLLPSRRMILFLEMTLKNLTLTSFLISSKRISRAVFLSLSKRWCNRCSKWCQLISLHKQCARYRKSNSKFKSWIVVWSSLQSSKTRLHPIWAIWSNQSLWPYISLRQWLRQMITNSINVPQAQSLVHFQKLKWTMMVVPSINLAIQGQ